LKSIARILPGMWHEAAVAATYLRVDLRSVEKEEGLTHVSPSWVSSAIAVDYLMWHCVQM
jgi:hypothetical protein